MGSVPRAMNRISKISFQSHKQQTAYGALADASGELKGATLAAGFRWHLNPQPHGLTLSAGPLAGAVDLSGVPPAERTRFLGSLGVEVQRPDANLVVLGLPASSALPQGAGHVALSYETSTMGNLGVALRVSIRLGR